MKKGKLMGIAVASASVLCAVVRYAAKNKPTYENEYKKLLKVMRELVLIHAKVVNKEEADADITTATYTRSGIITDWVYFNLRSEKGYDIAPARTYLSYETVVASKKLAETRLAEMKKRVRKGEIVLSSSPQVYQAILESTVDNLKQSANILRDTPGIVDEYGITYPVSTAVIHTIEHSINTHTAKIAKIKRGSVKKVSDEEFIDAICSMQGSAKQLFRYQCGKKGLQSFVDRE